jgi:Spy/CpxP family protein refolding chaperone
MNAIGFRLIVFGIASLFLGLGVTGGALADDRYPMMGWGEHRGMMGYGYEQREHMLEEAQKSGQMPYAGPMGSGMMGPGMMGYGGHMSPGMMGCGGHMGPGMMGEIWAIMQLDLTEDQEKAISEIHRKLRRENWARMGDMMEHQDRLSELYGADTLDAKAITQVYDAIFALQRQKIGSALQAHNEARALLSDDQRKSLKEETRRSRRHMRGFGYMR